MKSDQNESTFYIITIDGIHEKTFIKNFTHPTDDLWSYYTCPGGFLVVWDNRTTANVDPCNDLLHLEQKCTFCTGIDNNNNNTKINNATAVLLDKKTNAC